MTIIEMLEKKNLPGLVWIHQDACRDYDFKTAKYIAASIKNKRITTYPVMDGMVAPMPSKFLASMARMMEKPEIFN